MTHQIVSPFILEQYALGHTQGHITAASLFVDISGFSKIMYALMSRGQYGAELMAGIMRQLFDPLVAAIYAHDGFITVFAGDAFTALFPTKPAETDLTNGMERALAAGITILETIIAHPNYSADNETFTIGVKVGVASGECRWRIITAPDKKRATFYFRGTAINRAAAAEKDASTNQLLINPIVKEALPYLATTPVGEHHLLHSPFPTTSLPLHQYPPKPNSDIMSLFFDPSLFASNQLGEFRHIINIFISFPSQLSEDEVSNIAQTILALQETYGGVLNRLDFGDKGFHALLFWGVPRAYENDVDRALNFILTLQQQLTIPLRAGLTRQIAHAGVIGSSLQGEFTCYGNGVNLAARLMVAAPPHTIWLDENLFSKGRNHFDISPQKEQMFKGFSQPQAVYQLHGRQQSQMPQFTHPFIGHQAIRQKIVTFLEPLANGRSPGTLYLHGQAGTGKSHLIDTIRQQLNNSPHPPQWLFTHADPLITTTLNPFRYLLHQYFRLTTEQTADERAKMFRHQFQRLRAACPPVLQTPLGQAESFLAALVDIYWPNSPYDRLEDSPQNRFNNMVAGIINFLHACAHNQPTILYLEDAHWLDDATQAILPQISTALAETPFAILIVSRSPLTGSDEASSEPSWLTTSMTLSPLTTDEAYQLITTILPQAPAPDFCAELFKRAQGNPFFLIQLIKYLQAEDQLTTSPDGLTSSLSQLNTLPTDIQTVLVARIDQLPARTKETSQIAAILGYEWERPHLIATYEPDYELAPQLQTGEAADVWQALSLNHYIFTNTLLRDALYNMQVQSRRRQLHRQAAEGLEKLYADDLLPHCEALAYHYQQAEVWAKEYQYSFIAGQKAVGQYALPKGIGYFERALALINEHKWRPDNLVELYTLYGRALELQSRFDDALHTYQTMATVAQNYADERLYLQSLIHQGKIYATTNLLNNPQQAQILADEALKLATKLEEPLLAAEVHHNLLNLYRAVGDLSQASFHGQQALTLLDEQATSSLSLDQPQIVKRQTLEAFIFNDLSHTYSLTGQKEAHFNALQRSRDLWRRLDNLPMLTDNLSTAAMHHAFVGNTEKCIVLAQEAYEISVANHNLWGQAYAKHAIGFAYLDRDPPQLVIEALSTAVALSEPSGFMVPAFMDQATLAIIYSELDETESALTALEQALSLSNIPPSFQAYMLSAQAYVHWRLGNYETFEALLPALQDMPHEGPAIIFCFGVQAEVNYWLEKGEWERGYRLITKHIEDLKVQNGRLFLARALHSQARALIGLGHLTAARHTLDEAQQTAQQLKSTRLIPLITATSQQLDQI
ncbi:MAG TPA: AAA family ATPase [Anaerolineae bacterium]|nr:AAA family ATPase [Anaerolineae bacterium]